MKMQTDYLTKATLDESLSTADQGFTRPKVLILTPFKQMAYDIVEMIIMLTHNGTLKKVSKRKKFKLDFGNEEDAFNDDFKIGLSFKHARKSGDSVLKLYESFYNSDIIVASPLAIRMLTG